MLVKTEKDLNEVSGDMFNLWMKRVGVVFRKTVYSTPVIGLICIFAQLVNLIRQILTPKGIVLTLVILFIIDIQKPLTKFISDQLEDIGTPISLDVQLKTAEDKLKSFQDYHEKVTRFDESLGWKDRRDNSICGVYHPSEQYLERIKIMCELENSTNEIRTRIQALKSRN